MEIMDTKVRACGRRKGVGLVRTTLWVTVAVAAGPAAAQSWINTLPAGASWFDAANWNPAQVPLAGGTAVVSNGGTALLDTVASGGAMVTPQLGALVVGLADEGTGAGVVSSTGVDVLAGTLSVGTALAGPGSFADGLQDIGSAGLSASTTRIGTMFNQAAATSVLGRVVVDGTLQVGTGSFEVAQLFNSATGSFAEGRLTAQDLSGSLGGGFWIVGNVTSFTEAQVGSRALAEVVATSGGALDLRPGVNVTIGTTFGFDRVADGGGTRISEATGSVKLAGSLNVQGNSALLVGRGFGGRVDGSLELGTLTMTGGLFNNTAVGTSTSDGQARGRVAVVSGDMAVTGGMAVGNTVGGIADGGLRLDGGALRGDGTGPAWVGRANAAPGQLAQATGDVRAAGGVVGFSGYDVGVLIGPAAAGSFARGTLMGTGDAGALPVGGDVNVGLLSGAAGAAEASGEFVHGGSLAMAGVLQVAQTFNAAAGSSTNGRLQVAGDLGSAQGGFLIVGNVTSFLEEQVGSTALGEVAVGGGVALQGGVSIIVGTTFGFDRVVSGGVTQVNQATGNLQVAGTLSTSANPGALLVGRGFGGRVDGTLQLGRLAMGSHRFDTVAIGTSSEGIAHGDVEIGGGNLRAGTLAIGISSIGTASGRLALNATALDVTSVQAGTGTGVATLEIRDSAASVADDFWLENGVLLLSGSLLTVGDEFRLGNGSQLRVDINDLPRGTGFGAVDALSAILGGQIELDLSDLVFGAPTLVFDLVRGSLGISGDFGGITLLGLANGYQATTGIFLSGNEAVYRLTLSQLAVPEPASVALVLGGLMALVALRRRRPAAHLARYILAPWAPFEPSHPSASLRFQ